MKSIIQKKTFQMRLVIVVIAVFILFMSTTKNVFADCTQQDNGFVFLHPFFAGTYWKFSSESIDITVPQLLCDNKPFRYFTTGTYDSSAGLIIDSTGLVSIHIARYAPKECPCCHIQFLLDNPIATTLRISRDVAAAFVNKSSVLDTLYFAYQKSPTSINIVSIAKNGALIYTSSFSLGNQGALVITAINSSPSDRKKGFMVSGSQGLVRYIPVTPTGIGPEVVYDITSTTDTIMFASFSTAYATNGVVYEWSGNALVKSTTLDIQGTYASPNSIADNRTVFVKNGTIWNKSSDLQGPIHGSNMIRSSSGVAIEYLSDNWGLGVINLADSQAVISSLSPKSMSQYVNKGIYQYTFSKVETLTVVASDPDSNTQLPEITVENGISMNSIFSRSPYSLKGRGVDILCEIGIAKMNSDTFRVILRPDSVIYESNFLLGVTNIICNTPGWSKRKLHFSEKWYNNSNCSIKIGADKILIHANSGLSTMIKNNMVQKGISLSYRKSLLRCLFLDRSHPGGSISFWSINGRLVNKIQFARSTAEISAPLPFTDQMVIFRVDFSDGTYFEQKLIPLR
jgi:hypothetical protein